MAHTPEKLLLAAPRGYCAGVDRAVQTVERALELYGAPVYVRKEIVHNKHVVQQLRERGAIFVESETEVPEGATAVFSAHGVAPERARERRPRASCNVIDATCPLVTKVHVEAQEVRRRGLHDRDDRPRGPRGGRGHDGRGARAHRARAERGGRRRARGRRTRSGSPTSRRRRCQRRRDPRDHPAPARALPRDRRARAPTTSVTPPPTARRRSRSSRRSATSCW